MSVNIISRDKWNAKPCNSKQGLRVNPPKVLMIHHSETAACTTPEACKFRVANIQDHHIRTNGWNDIGYNFLIGGDGNVYEGRGWGVTGAHCPDYNGISVGICLIGSFEAAKPSDVQLVALKNLIHAGVASGKIDKDYSLVGHRQGRATKCPGDALFNEIKTWPHFDNNIKK